MRSGRRDAGGLWLVGGYLVGWMGVLVAVTAITAVLVVLARGLDALGDGALDLPAWTFVVIMGIQQPAMLGLVGLTHAFVGATYYRHRPGARRPRGWRGVFAWWRAPWWTYALAVGIGFTTGWLPGWIAERISEWAPTWTGGTLAMIEQVFAPEAGPWRWVAVAEVVIGAAVVEELVFRGFMWDALRRHLGVVGTWVATSLVFAAYHMDPVQAPAVVFTGFVLGWVRWTTGSVGPAIVLHAANNGLATLGTMLGTGAEDPFVPTPGIVALATTVTVALCVAIGVARRATSGSLDVDGPWGPA